MTFTKEEYDKVVSERDEAQAANARLREVLWACREALCENMLSNMTETQVSELGDKCDAVLDAAPERPEQHYLEAENRRLREALEPFALAANVWSTVVPDDRRLTVAGTNPSVNDCSVGDLRHAQSALAAAPGLTLREERTMPMRKRSVRVSAEINSCNSCPFVGRYPEDGTVNERIDYWLMNGVGAPNVCKKAACRPVPRNGPIPDWCPEREQAVGEDDDCKY